jgi:hypothetical protein
MAAARKPQPPPLEDGDPLAVDAHGHRLSMRDRLRRTEDE